MTSMNPAPNLRIAGDDACAEQSLALPDQGPPFVVGPVRGQHCAPVDLDGPRAAGRCSIVQSRLAGVAPFM